MHQFCVFVGWGRRGNGRRMQLKTGDNEYATSPRAPKRTGFPWKPWRNTELGTFFAFLNSGTNWSQLAEIRQVWELSNYGFDDKALHEKMTFHPGPTETWVAIDLLLHLAGLRRAWIVKEAAQVRTLFCWLMVKCFCGTQVLSAVPFLQVSR